MVLKNIRKTIDHLLSVAHKVSYTYLTDNQSIRCGAVCSVHMGNTDKFVVFSSLFTVIHTRRLPRVSLLLRIGAGSSSFKFMPTMWGFMW